MSLFKKCAVIAALNSLAMVSAFAQTTPPPAAVSPTPAPVAADQTSPAAAPAPAAAPTWSVGPLDISGTVDGSYSFNANHPESPNNFNGLYNFNDKADTFDLSMAKLTLNHDPDPVGVHFDFGFGRTFDDLASAGGEKYIEQAFVSLKPPKGKGVELDFGQFVTSAGAEVIEAKDNWNYSRSLLFTNAIPYDHFGLRMTMPLGKTFTAGFQLVNGWNNTSDNNSGKTIGLTGALVKPKFSLFGNYYVGPENANTNKGFRNLLDTTLLLTPPGKFSAYINYDYGQNRNAAVVEDSVVVKVDTFRPRIFSLMAPAPVLHFKPSDSTSTPYQTTDLTHWEGIAGDIHFQATPKIAISPRGEYFQILEGPSNFQVGEITLTGEYKFITGALMRVEYRGDFANSPVFVKNATGSSKQQNTLTFALVAFFGPHR